MDNNRRLSAIMFTDIVGYTTMISSNENTAIEAVMHHKKVMEEFVSRFQGELIHFYGDGSLSIYSSATNAVEAAIAVQNKFRSDPQLPLRVGIHIGEILMKEGSIYGKGVNIASRIESIGQSGAILFSE